MSSPLQITFSLIDTFVCFLSILLFVFVFLRSKSMSEAINTISKRDLEEVLDRKLNQFFAERMAPLQKSLDFLSQEYDDSKRETAKQQSEIKNLQLENAALRREVGNLKSSFNNQQTWLNDLEQYVQRECLEFRGIPSTASEDTCDLVVKVANLAGVDITRDDISTSHRIRPKADQSKFPPPIIAKFICRDTRNDIYRARGRLRDFTTKDLDLGRHAESDIYISESLTEKNKLLFNNALKVRKELKYRFIWSNYGKIFLRRDEHSAPVEISSEADLARLTSHQGLAQRRSAGGSAQSGSR